MPCSVFSQSDLDFINDNFFFIDTYNCNSINPRFYGYVISDNQLHSNSRYSSNIDHSLDYGAFIDIKKSSDTLIIKQDYWGAFGLYIYKRDKYFALSNSFIYLIEKLKGNNKLSIDYIFLNNTITEELVSLSYKRSPVSEIEQLAKNEYIIIDTINKELYIEKINHFEWIIDVDSNDAISILDGWYTKWASLITSLSNQGYNIISDLSGGMDSRAVFSLFLNLKNFNSIRINSAIDESKKHKEDYKIATLVANKYGIKLNNQLIYDSYRTSPYLSVYQSFLIKGCFHRQFYFKNFYHDTPVFHFGGGGGEGLRNYWDMDYDTFISDRINNNHYISINCEKQIIQLHHEQNSEMSHIYKYYKNNIQYASLVYKYIRIKNHYAKSMVEDFMAGVYTINPLMDPQLQKINIYNETNDDNNLLFALIYTRYIDKVKSLEFQGKPSLDHGTLKYALDINNKYKKSISLNFDYLIDIERNTIPSKSSNNTKPQNILDDIFNSKKGESLINHLIGDEAYRRAINYSKNFELHKSSPKNHLLSFALLKLMLDCNNSDFIQIISNCEIIDNNIDNKNIQKVFNALQTFRLDIKTSASTYNDIVLESKQNFKLLNAPWLTDSCGKGYVLQSNQNNFDINFSCSEDGIVLFAFRAPDVYKQMPQIKIVYTSIKIDGKHYLNKNTTTSISQPLRYEFNVHKNKIYNMEIKWFPFSYDLDTLLTIIRNLYYSDLRAF